MTNSREDLQTTVVAPGIVCGGCAESIRRALGGIEGVRQVAVDVPSKAVTVDHDGAVTRDRIVEAAGRVAFALLLGAPAGRAALHGPEFAEA